MIAPLTGARTAYAVAEEQPATEDDLTVLSFIPIATRDNSALQIMTSVSEIMEGHSAGDPLPPKCKVIEVHVAELKQLFNSIDPSPFRNRDLERRSSLWAGPRTYLQMHRSRLWSISIVLPACRMRLSCCAMRFMSFSVSELRLFAALARSAPRGPDEPGDRLGSVGSCYRASDSLASLMKGSRFAEIVRESLTVGGWVSMWRPLEIFLYDWWPVRREARLAEKLAVVPVRIRYMDTAAPESWRGDWPAVSPEREQTEKQRRTGTD